MIIDLSSEKSLNLKLEKKKKLGLKKSQLLHNVWYI